METLTEKSEQKINKKRFETRPDGWVKDMELGIEWGPSSKRTMNFEEAEEYCKEKSARLPTLKELTSLVDYGRSKPAIDTEFFKDTKTDDWYWTGTRVAGFPGIAWCVDFCYGSVNCCRQDSLNYVRPVRASQ